MLLFIKKKKKNFSSLFQFCMSHSLSTKKCRVLQFLHFEFESGFALQCDPGETGPSSWWKEFVDGHLLAQAEFNVFDAGLFEVLTADLGHHCVGEGRIFFARHVHRQVQPALYAVYVLFCKVGSRHAKPSEADICGLSYEDSGWSESCLIGSWRKRQFPLVEDNSPRMSLWTERVHLSTGWWKPQTHNPVEAKLL